MKGRLQGHTLKIASWIFTMYTGKNLGGEYRETVVVEYMN